MIQSNRRVADINSIFKGDPWTSRQEEIGGDILFFDFGALMIESLGFEWTIFVNIQLKVFYEHFKN